MERGAPSLDWDDGNREKCQKHGLSIADIEYVLAHGETFIVPDVKNFEDEPRFIAVGRSPGGRYAFVVFTPPRRNDGTVWRPISARYMHKKEIVRYEKEISSAQDRRRG
jgi:uncharacterized DUF497 family protein